MPDPTSPAEPTAIYPYDPALRRDENRRALVTLSPDLLAAILRLPDGIRIVAAGWNDTRGMIRLVIEGEPLPGLEPGSELLDISRYAQPHQLDHDGQLWYRVDWDLPWTGDRQETRTP